MFYQMFLMFSLLQMFTCWLVGRGRRPEPVHHQARWEQQGGASLLQVLILGTYISSIDIIEQQTGRKIIAVSIDKLVVLNIGAF